MNPYRIILAAALLTLVGVPVVYAGPLINKHLPPMLKSDIELRQRIEYRNNFDFNDARDDEDAFYLKRLRVSLNFIPVKEWNLFIQGQDSRIFDSEYVNKATFENQMDVRQLYINYEDAVAFETLQINKVSARFGRQEFSYGAQRLLGAFNWSNLAQTFDGVKAGVHFVPLHVGLEFFWGNKSPIKTPREFDDLFDETSQEQIWGYYATAKPFGDTIVEHYLISRNTDKVVSFGPSGSGDIEDYTVGGRIKNAFPNGIDYELEVAKQWGDFKNLEVDGMMTIALIGYTFKAMAWKPRIGFEFDYGSGDSDRSDGKMSTFDNLYPTNHLFYGYADLISLQNLNDYILQFNMKPNKKLKIQTDFHMMYLDTVKDSYYSVARAVVRTATSSNVDDHFGNEIDFTTDYKFNDNLSFLLGYSYFIPGQYLKDTGAHDDTHFAYFQTTVSF